jgi:hypothetical protein
MRCWELPTPSMCKHPIRRKGKNFNAENWKMKIFSLNSHRQYIGPERMQQLHVLPAEIDTRVAIHHRDIDLIVIVRVSCEVEVTLEGSHFNFQLQIVQKPSIFCMV